MFAVGSKLCNDLYIMCQNNSTESLEKSLSMHMSDKHEMLLNTLQETVNDQDQTLLHIAAQLGHTSIIERLLAAGVDPSYPYVHCTLIKNVSNLI